MRWVIFFLVAAYFVTFASASDTGDFITQVSQNPSLYSIVVGNSISSEEYILAENISVEMGIGLFNESEISDSLDLILVGNSTANNKTYELGNISMGSYYAFNGNLFVAGTKMQNVDVLRIIYSELVNVSNSDSSQNVIEDESESNDTGFDSGISTASSGEGSGWFGSVTRRDSIIILVLAVVAVGIVAFLIYSFFKKPKFQSQES